MSHRNCTHIIIARKVTEPLFFFWSSSKLWQYLVVSAFYNVVVWKVYQRPVAIVIPASKVCSSMNFIGVVRQRHFLKKNSDTWMDKHMQGVDVRRGSSSRIDRERRWRLRGWWCRWSGWWLSISRPPFPSLFTRGFERLPIPSIDDQCTALLGICTSAYITHTCVVQAAPRGC